MKIYGLRIDYNLRGDGEFFVYSDLPELVKRIDQGKLTEVIYGAPVGSGWDYRPAAKGA